MPNIKIIIENKRATAEGAPVIVCGNSDYTATFAFDEEWNAADFKTARFAYIKNGEAQHEDVVFSGDTAAVPVLSDIDFVKVGVFAGDLCTTTPARIPCAASILCGSGAPQEPSEDVYNQLLAEINEVAEQNAETIEGFRADTKAIADEAKATADDAKAIADEAKATADDAKSVATATQTEAKAYTDQKIADLINGAPSTLDTLKEVAEAMAEHEDVVEALHEAVGTKANDADLKAHTADTDNPHEVTKAQVGLGNVDNTSDADKPISTAQQAAFDAINSNLEQTNSSLDSVINAIGKLKVFSHKLDGGKSITITTSLYDSYLIIGNSNNNVVRYAGICMFGTYSGAYIHEFFKGTNLNVETSGSNIIITNTATSTASNFLFVKLGSTNNDLVITEN